MFPFECNLNAWSIIFSFEVLVFLLVEIEISSLIYPIENGTGMIFTL